MGCVGDRSAGITTPQPATLHNLLTASSHTLAVCAHPQQERHEAGDGSAAGGGSGQRGGAGAGGAAAGQQQQGQQQQLTAHKWRQREKLKTTAVALVLCLNIGVDPPDVVKVSPCARLECWVDPLSMQPAKALETIGKNLQAQYERWQPRAKYKMHLDPTLDDVRKLAASCRRAARAERVLFHYNGHGVPRPTANGEVWVFNSRYTQYIPLSVYELQAWLGTPAIYVLDCSAAGLVINSLRALMDARQQQAAQAAAAAAAQQQQQQQQGQQQGGGVYGDGGVPGGSGGSGGSGGAVPAGGGGAPTAAASSAAGVIDPMREVIVLAACGANELLPQDPDLPADVFTACLTTPIKVALRWFVSRSLLRHDGLTKDLIDRIPGRQTDRKTPLGELNWIFTAVTDTIAWNTLPRAAFQRLFRQDLLVASLFRNFLLAERVMAAAGATPASWPRLPPTHQHAMWQAWDMAAETCLLQLPGLLADPPTAEFVPSPFFGEQLAAFELWLAHGGADKRPPEQLPIVLQVLLSQVHRLRALVLLGRFLDMGGWAVDLALSVGIFPYVLKLLQTTSPDLRATLVFIWAKILALDAGCRADLAKDGGHLYFLRHLDAAAAAPPAAAGHGAAAVPGAVPGAPAAAAPQPGVVPGAAEALGADAAGGLPGGAGIDHHSRAQVQRRPPPVSAASSLVLTTPCLLSASTSTLTNVAVPPPFTPYSHTQAVFVLATVCDGHPRGQALCLQANLPGSLLRWLRALVPGLAAIEAQQAAAAAAGGAPPAAAPRGAALLAEWCCLALGRAVEDAPEAAAVRCYPFVVVVPPLPPHSDCCGAGMFGILPSAACLLRSPPISTSSLTPTAPRTTPPPNTSPTARHTNALTRRRRCATARPSCCRGCSARSTRGCARRRSLRLAASSTRARAPAPAACRCRPTRARRSSSSSRARARTRRRRRSRLAPPRWASAPAAAASARRRARRASAAAWPARRAARAARRRPPRCSRPRSPRSRASRRCCCAPTSCTTRARSCAASSRPRSRALCAATCR